jgi:hypothetical protein
VSAELSIACAYVNRLLRVFEIAVLVFDVGLFVCLFASAELQQRQEGRQEKVPLNVDVEGLVGSHVGLLLLT